LFAVILKIVHYQIRPAVKEIFINASITRLFHVQENPGDETALSNAWPIPGRRMCMPLAYGGPWFWFARTSKHCRKQFHCRIHCSLQQPEATSPSTGIIFLMPGIVFSLIAQNEMGSER